MVTKEQGLADLPLAPGGGVAVCQARKEMVLLPKLWYTPIFFLLRDKLFRTFTFCLFAHLLGIGLFSSSNIVKSITVDVGVQISLCWLSHCF